MKDYADLPTVQPDAQDDWSANLSGDPWPPYEVLAPEAQCLPLVFASPHSGKHYPPPFVEASRLDPTALRRSEDAFVDELFAAAPALGAPLVSARFPRAYVDPNREPFELDPAMFEDALPDYVNTASPRVAGGLGTIARVVTNGTEIYKEKLRFGEALRRIETLYRPYHRVLEKLVAATRERFGACILIDCHSMPSIGGPMDQDPGAPRVDFVLGDRYGRTCDPSVTRRAEEVLVSRGYRVARNTPYAGGFTTGHYGQPDAGVHALQIEVNRALYMDETRITRSTGLQALAREMRVLIEALARLDPARLARA
ncbi:MAG: N-formylglutamate amidohydrolase [Alphaproteobacteria bacterium]|nr:N-formylglutamate amidohydrolase [Alphaproteobacteria bacterium]